MNTHSYSCINQKISKVTLNFLDIPDILPLLQHFEALIPHEYMLPALFMYCITCDLRMNSHYFPTEH